LRGEFGTDGFGQLREAIVHAGSIERWADEFASRSRGICAAASARTDARLESELRRFAAGRELFPTCTEFGDASQVGLLGALRRHGGVELWAARLEMPRRQRYSGRVAVAK